MANKPTNTITKKALLEMIHFEVELNEKKKLLENKMIEIKNEMKVLTESDEKKKEMVGAKNKSDKPNTKKKEKEVDEGLGNVFSGLKNVGSAIGNKFAGAAKQAGQAISNKASQVGTNISNKASAVKTGVQNTATAVGNTYKAGVTQNKVQDTVNGIKQTKMAIAQKTEQMNQLKKEYQALTGKVYGQALGKKNMATASNPIPGKNVNQKQVKKVAESKGSTKI
jgi:hypothetical protein